VLGAECRERDSCSLIAGRLPAKKHEDAPSHTKALMTDDRSLITGVRRAIHLPKSGGMRPGLTPPYLPQGRLKAERRSGRRSDFTLYHGVRDCIKWKFGNFSGWGDSLTTKNHQGERTGKIRHPAGYRLDGRGWIRWAGRFIDGRVGDCRNGNICRKAYDFSWPWRSRGRNWKTT